MSQVECRIGDHGDPSLREAELLYADVYRTAGLINDIHILNDDGTISDTWSSAATHFGVYEAGTAIGHLRLIDKSTGPLPCEQLSTNQLNLSDNAVELSGLATRRLPTGSSSGKMVQLLFAHVFKYSIEQGITEWTGIATAPEFAAWNEALEITTSSVLQENITWGNETLTLFYLNLATLGTPNPDAGTT